MQTDPERYFDRILFARRFSQIESYCLLACVPGQTQTTRQTTVQDSIDRLT